jgi:hypothetical protein
MCSILRKNLGNRVFQCEMCSTSKGKGKNSGKHYKVMNQWSRTQVTFWNESWQCLFITLQAQRVPSWNAPSWTYSILLIQRIATCPKALSIIQNLSKGFQKFLWTFTNFPSFLGFRRERYFVIGKHKSPFRRFQEGTMLAWRRIWKIWCEVHQV